MYIIIMSKPVFWFYHTCKLFTLTKCLTLREHVSVIYLGEKEISPKVLKISPKVLMITFGVTDVTRSYFTRTFLTLPSL